MKNTVFGIAIVGFAVGAAVNVLCMLSNVFVDPICTINERGLEFGGWTQLFIGSLHTVLLVGTCLLTYHCGYKRRALQHELTRNASAWCVATLASMLCCTGIELYWQSSKWLDRDINAAQIITFVVAGTLALISYRRALLGLTTGAEHNSQGASFSH